MQFFSQRLEQKQKINYICYVHCKFNQILLIQFRQMELNYKQQIMTLLILTLLLSLSSSLSPTPLYCSSEQYMFADSYTFSTTASYNKPSPLPSPLTATVTFPKPQADNLYQLAVSLQKLDYVITANFRINIFVKYTARTSSSFRVNVYSLNTSCIHLLGFRYLVIHPNFTKISVAYISGTPNILTNSTAPCTITGTGLTPIMSISNLSIPIVVFAGFDVESTNSSKNFKCQNAAYTPTSANILIITVFPLFVYSTQFLLLRYNVTTAANSPVLRITFVRNSYIGAGSYNINQQSAINTFFGMSSHVIGINENYLNFDLSAKNRTVNYKTNNSGTALVNVMIVEGFLNTCCPYDCLNCNPTNGKCTSCAVYDYRILYVTLGRCLPKFGYYNKGNLGQAQPCASDCYACNSLTDCTICFRGKSRVIGGCSDVNGCIEISTNRTCIACSKQYTMTADNLCVCQPDTWLVKGYCTNIVGCVSTMMINEILVCLFCEHGFTLANDSCWCPYGFTLDNTVNKCVEICGDGILFTDPCDDGNLINGDVCSSICHKQSNFKCFNGSLMSPSRCFYNKDYKIYVNSINKTEFKNQGVFAFKIRPTISSVISQNFIESLLFVCGQNISVEGWALHNNLLTIKVNYSEDLEGNEAKLSLRLNSSYPIQSFLNITFTMNSGGLKLLIYRHYDQIVTISKIVFGILSIPLILFVLGSLRHKMVGVQILTTFQIIVFTSTLTSNYTEPYALLNYLSSCTGNFLFFSNRSSNFYSRQPSLWSLFTFDENNLFFSQYIVGGVILLFIFVPIIRLIMQGIWKKQDQKNIFEKADCVTSAIYNHGLFPFAIGFLFINVFAYSSSAYSNFHFSVNRISMIIMQLFLVITTAVIFFYEWAQVLTASLKDVNTDKANSLTKPNIHFERCHKDYIPGYLTYLLAIFSLFWLENISNTPHPLIPIISITFIALVWFVIHPFYEDTIHKAGQILNFGLILSFSVWTMLRELSPVFMVEENQIFAIFIILGLMIASLIVNTVRILFEYRRLLRCKESKGASSPIVQNHKVKSDNVRDNNKNEFTHKLQQMNPYSLYSQLMRQQNTKWEELNKQRLLNDTSPLYLDGVKEQFLSANREIKMSVAEKQKKQGRNKGINLKKNERLRDKTYLEERKNHQTVQ